MRFAYEKQHEGYSIFLIMRGRHLSFVSTNLLIYTRSLFALRGGVSSLKTARYLGCVCVFWVKGIQRTIQYPYSLYTHTFTVLQLRDSKCYMLHLCVFFFIIYARFRFLLFRFYLCFWLSRFPIYTCICPFTFIYFFFFVLGFLHFVSYFYCTN